MERAERERAAQDNDKLLAALLHSHILQHLGQESSPGRGANAEGWPMQEAGPTYLGA